MPQELGSSSDRIATSRLLKPILIKTPSNRRLLSQDLFKHIERSIVYILLQNIEYESDKTTFSGRAFQTGTTLTAKKLNRAALWEIAGIFNFCL